MALQVRDLSFHYPSGEGALALAELEVAAGETIALVGPSGAGKTTLLKLIAGILEPRTGSVTLDGQELHRLSAPRRSELRLKKMGVVFQDFALLDYLTVAENILLPMEMGGFIRPIFRERGRSLAERLEIVHYWRKRSAELSQGERQRVAIARALAHEPMLVLADEPTASLDDRRKNQAARLILEDAKQRQAALIMATHDPALLPLFDRILTLGEIKA